VKRRFDSRVSPIDTSSMPAGAGAINAYVATGRSRTRVMRAERSQGAIVTAPPGRGGAEELLNSIAYNPKTKLNN
jgi:hypothetical protein